MGARISILTLVGAVACSFTPPPAEPEFDVDDPAAFGEADDGSTGPAVADDGTAGLRYHWTTDALAQRVVVSDTTSVTTYKGEKVEDEANVVTIDVSAAVVEPRDETYILEYTLDSVAVTGADETTTNYLVGLAGAKHRTGVTPRGESRQVGGVTRDLVSWFIATLQTPVLPDRGVEVGGSWPNCVIWDVDELERMDIECTVAAIDGDRVSIAVKGSCGVWFEVPDLPGVDTEAPIAIEEQSYDIDCTYELDLSQTLPISWQCAASGAASGKANGKPFSMTTSVKRSMRAP